MSNSEFTYTISGLSDKTDGYSADRQATTFIVNEFWQAIQDAGIDQDEKPSEIFRQLFGPEHGVHLPLDD